MAGRRSFLWIVSVSWLALAARVALSDVGSISNPLNWLYFGAVCSGVLASTAGLVAVHKRGEGSLAVGVFALSLALPMLYVLFFGFLWLLLGSATAPPTEAGAVAVTAIAWRDPRSGVIPASLAQVTTTRFRCLQRDPGPCRPLSRTTRQAALPGNGRDSPATTQPLMLMGRHAPRPRHLERTDPLRNTGPDHRLRRRPVVRWRVRLLWRAMLRTRR